MSKKRRKSRPVVEAKKNKMVVTVELEAPVCRDRIPVGERFHTRELDVKKGRRRHGKHKGKEEHLGGRDFSRDRHLIESVKCLIDSSDRSFHLGDQRFPTLEDENMQPLVRTL